VTIEDLLRHTSGISYDYIGSDLIMMAYRDGDIFKGNFTNKDLCRAHCAPALGKTTRHAVALRPFQLMCFGRVIEIVSGTKRCISS